MIKISVCQTATYKQCNFSDKMLGSNFLKYLYFCQRVKVNSQINLNESVGYHLKCVRHALFLFDVQVQKMHVRSAHLDRSDKMAGNRICP